MTASGALQASPGQIAALRALVTEGDMKRAAHSLGIAPAAFEHRLRKLRGRTGMTLYQLAAALGVMDR